MGEHVHEWKRSSQRWGAYYCANDSCDEFLNSEDVEARLNATERLSADRARIASIMASKMPSEFGEIKDNLIDALDAYADTLEGQ